MSCCFLPSCFLRYIFVATVPLIDRSCGNKDVCVYKDAVAPLKNTLKCLMFSYSGHRLSSLSLSVYQWGGGCCSYTPICSADLWRSLPAEASALSSSPLELLLLLLVCGFMWWTHQTRPLVVISVIIAYYTALFAVIQPNASIKCSCSCSMK